MSAARQPNDLTELRATLRADAADVAEALLGAPNKAASTRSTLRWGGKGSIAVVVQGARRGLWFSHEAVTGGDMLNLIQHALGCNFPDAIAWGQQRTGIAPRDVDEDDRAAQREADRQTRHADQAARDAAAEADDVARRVEIARRLWAESAPIGGTVAETYLFRTRGIPASDAWPDTVRFHASSRSLIVAATTDDGAVQAVQRVRLTADATKAEGTPGKPVKVTNGALGGAVVRLPAVAASAQSAPVRPSPLLIAEGPETALSVWAATGAEVWCALGSVANVDALPAGRPVVIAADDDASDTDSEPRRQGAAKALASALARWTGEGHQVCVVYPWAARRHDGSDFNDVLRADGVAAVRARIVGGTAPEPPPSRWLPTYHQAATEPRAEALVRQRKIIASTIGEGAERVAIWAEVRSRRDEEAERIEAETWEEVSPQQKAALTRRFTKEALTQRGMLKMPAARQVLITGTQGSGKTAAALEELSLIGNPLVVWMTVPSLDKAEEALADYQRLAGPRSLPAMVVRGRGAPDPEHPDYRNGELLKEAKTKMCHRPKVAAKVAKRGLSVRKLICPKCPLNEVCGSIRQEQAIGAMKNRGVFFMARNYLALQSPAPLPDILVADERITVEAVDDVLSINPDILRSAIPFPGADLGATIRGGQAIDRMRAALMKPNALAAIRETDGLANELRAALKLLDAAMKRHEPEIDGSMSDGKIASILDDLPTSNLGNVASTVRAVLRELPTGRATLTAVEFDPNHKVKVDGKEERLPRFIVHRLRKVHFPPVVLLLDGTGSPALNRVLLPNLEHHHVAIERNAYVVGTTGKSYSRQSITGADRDGNLLDNKNSAAKRLRREIAAATRAMPGDVLLAGSKQAVEAIKQDGLLPDKVRMAHFGAVRGLNTWETAETGFVIGRESISLAQLENLARAFLATDPVPFVSFAKPDLNDWPWPTWPYRATRGRRMRDGTVQAVEVEVHPDPRVQEVLEQIREAEVLQGVDRVRPIFNRRYLMLANDLVLDVTYDRTLTHAELSAGGTRWDRAWNATGVVPLGAADLHQVHPEVFPSQGKAKELLRALKESGGDLQIDSYLGNTPTCFRYRREGQRGSASRVAVDTRRHRNPRLAVEAFLGPLVLFEPIGPMPPPNSPEPRPSPPKPDPAADLVMPWQDDLGRMPADTGLSATGMARCEGLANEPSTTSNLPSWWNAEVPDPTPSDMERAVAQPVYDLETQSIETESSITIKLDNPPAAALLEPGWIYSAVPRGAALLDPVNFAIRLQAGAKANAVFSQRFPELASRDPWPDHKSIRGAIGSWLPRAPAGSVKHLQEVPAPHSP